MNDKSRIPGSDSDPSANADELIFPDEKLASAVPGGADVPAINKPELA